MCYSALAVSGHYCLQVTIAPAYPNTFFAVPFFYQMSQLFVMHVMQEPPAPGLEGELLRTDGPPGGEQCHCCPPPGGRTASDGVLLGKYDMIDR